MGHVHGYIGGMDINTCRYCGTAIYYPSQWAEWHATRPNSPEHYVNVCAGHDGGHAPLTDAERCGAATAPYRVRRAV